jgi:ATP-dependent RNA helicase DDX41
MGERSLRKRRRAAEEEEEDEETKLLRQVSDEEEYVPLSKRREQQLQHAAETAGIALQQPGTTAPATSDTDATNAGASKPADPENGNASNEHGTSMSSGIVREFEKGSSDQQQKGSSASLLKQAAERAKHMPHFDESEHQVEEENEIMRNVTDSKALLGAQERAQGVWYSQPMQTGWRPPRKYREMSEEKRASVRERENMSVQGENVPPPITSFKHMRLPNALTKQLELKQITKPTPIQMQGLPTVLAGRDMIGVAFTGSGKTLVFALPLIAFALMNEKKMPLQRSEGPIGLVLCPSRELAGQTHSVIQSFLDALVKDGEPELRNMHCVGGVDAKAQLDTLSRGCHTAVATPGRLKDHLSKRRMRFDHCRYLCLDEADRMLDLGFEDDIQEVYTHFKAQRQTVMFSATMPTKIKSFAKSSLVQPVVVNVSRAGAASLDVIQEVEYVKDEAKLVYLLECLQKTAPPVLIFAENKSDVDSVHEYLLLKGVDAVAIHGSKSQEERSSSVAGFKEGNKDVLVATDVASKGLDFPDIQHVINYDMPGEIENYVHRIGRTGRCGNTGIATTFINKNQSEKVLLDLKLQLKEANQKIPPVLNTIDDPTENAAQTVQRRTGVKGCGYCGGLGHRVTDCPKLQQYKEQQMREKNRKDPFSAGGFGAEL